MYRSAVLFSVFGLERREKQLLHRALELLECSHLLLTQNTDPKINEDTLYGIMAEILLSLEDNEQAVALLKKHNAGGLYNDLIGLTLAGNCNRCLSLWNLFCPIRLRTDSRNGHPVCQSDEFYHRPHS